MDANLSIKQPWHTVYCHLRVSYSYLSANYATHYMLTPAKNYAVKTGQPLFFQYLQRYGRKYIVVVKCFQKFYGGEL